MGRIHETFTDQLAAFIDSQPMFFVATAPLDSGGHVNLSPKGADSLQIAGPNTVVYADLTGSGAETIAHLRENGRITIMWCSFGNKPRILRAYGRGEYLLPDHREFPAVAATFPNYRGLRSIIRISVSRIADSCGYGVPIMEMTGQRPRMIEWGERKSPEELRDYMKKNNTVSIDGLPAWEG